jgi:hypothetical protein
LSEAGDTLIPVRPCWQGLKKNPNVFTIASDQHEAEVPNIVIQQEGRLVVLSSPPTHLEWSGQVLIFQEIAITVLQVEPHLVGFTREVALLVAEKVPCDE